MSKKDFKNILEQIQKYAAKPPKPPSGYVPQAPPAPKAPGTAGGVTHAPPKPGTHPTGHPTGVQPIPSVKAMQIAMQKLATTISETINYDTLNKGMQAPPPGISQEQYNSTIDKEDFNKSLGRDSFSNFMVNSFLRNSKMKGVEYDMDPTKSKMIQKSPSELRYMMVVLDSLQRIGKEASEKFADGNWGPRTNNALKNIAAISDSIMRLGKMLGMQSQAFDINKVAELQSLVPEKETALSAQEKATNAAKISEILNGVIALFSDFKDQVFRNPNYSNIINRKRPVFSFGEEKQADLQGGEEAILKKVTENPAAYAGSEATFTVNLPKEYFPGQQLQPIGISAANLVNRQAFENWADSNKVLQSLRKTNPDTWPNVAKQILQSVKSAVGNKLKGPAPQQAAAPQQPAQQPAAPQGKPA